MLLGVAARTAALTVTSRTLKAGTPPDGPFSPNASDRLQQCFQVRMNAARDDQAAGMPVQITNGDENRYSSRIGNYSKGLPHNTIGEVDPTAYQSLLKAVSTGNPQDFDRIVMGGSVKLVDPQSGLAFDMEGLDSHQFKMDAPPALASAERAGEAVEVYWMALLRDVNFADYASSPLALAASSDLSRLSDFRGPKQGNKVTPQTLFRGFTPGDVDRPYVSQFLLKPLEYGAIHIDQRINTYLPLSAGGADYMTDPSSWLAVQNGKGPFGSNRIDPVPRYIRNGRDLAAYVHIDVLFEAYMNACLWLIDNGAPLNPGNPYLTSGNQTGFGTFGDAVHQGSGGRSGLAGAQGCVVSKVVRPSRAPSGRVWRQGPFHEDGSGAISATLRYYQLRRARPGGGAHGDVVAAARISGRLPAASHLRRGPRNRGGRMRDHGQGLLRRYRLSVVHDRYRAACKRWFVPDAVYRIRSEFPHHRRRNGQDRGQHRDRPQSRRSALEVGLRGLAVVG